MANFSEYDPGRLGLGQDEQFAREAWDFLNEPQIVQGMISATDLGHPAVAGVREALVARFLNLMNVERNRQRVGHMTRQIMERHGFELDQPEVKVNLYPFSKAARYRRKDSVALHVFRASSDHQEICVAETRSVTGFPQPSKGGRWIYWTCITSKLQAAVGFDIRNLHGLKNTVAQEGFVRLRTRRVLRAG
jgi:hypothetical protein